MIVLSDLEDAKVFYNNNKTGYVIGTTEGSKGFYDNISVSRFNSDFEVEWTSVVETDYHQLAKSYTAMPTRDNSTVFILDHDMTHNSVYREFEYKDLYLAAIDEEGNVTDRIKAVEDKESSTDIFIYW